MIGGRDTYGEPKKIGDVWARRDGDAIEAGVARMGFPVCEIRGRVTETREPYEKEKTDFWFKVSPSAETPGELDQDPLLVYGEVPRLPATRSITRRSMCSSPSGTRVATSR